MMEKFKQLVEDLRGLSHNNVYGTIRDVVNSADVEYVVRNGRLTEVYVREFYKNDWNLSMIQSQSPELTYNIFDVELTTLIPKIEHSLSLLLAYLKSQKPKPREQELKEQIVKLQTELKDLEDEQGTT